MKSSFAFRAETLRASKMLFFKLVFLSLLQCPSINEVRPPTRTRCAPARGAPARGASGGAASTCPSPRYLSSTGKFLPLAGDNFCHPGDRICHCDTFCQLCQNDTRVSKRSAKFFAYQNDTAARVSERHTLSSCLSLLNGSA